MIASGTHYDTMIHMLAIGGYPSGFRRGPAIEYAVVSSPQSVLRRHSDSSVERLLLAELRLSDHGK